MARGEEEGGTHKTVKYHHLWFKGFWIILILPLYKLLMAPKLIKCFFVKEKKLQKQPEAVTIFLF